MSVDTTTLLVRRRLAASTAGLAAFVVLGPIATDKTWAQPWLFVGIGLAVSATFLEPYFGTPRSAIANAAGGIGACVGADHGGIDGLWIALTASLGVVMIAGIVAAISRATAL